MDLRHVVVGASRSCCGPTPAAARRALHGVLALAVATQLLLPALHRHVTEPGLAAPSSSEAPRAPTAGDPHDGAPCWICKSLGQPKEFATAATPTAPPPPALVRGSPASAEVAGPLRARPPSAEPRAPPAPALRSA